MVRTNNELRQLQSLPLEAKIIFSKERIRTWYEENDGDVYCSVSGKDSTVMLDLVRELYPNIPAVTVDTGMEHPENRKFLKKIDNIEFLRPEKEFFEVLRDDGYPALSKMNSRKLYTLQNPTDRNHATRNLYKTGINRKGEFHQASMLPESYHYLIDSDIRFSHKCCDVMKKNPIYKYEKRSKRRGYVGTMAEESDRRKYNYLQYGCIVRGNKGYCRPISIWTEQDILEYIYINKLPISKAYGEVIINDNKEYETTGETRTGCIFCLYGIQREKEPNRIQRLKEQYPKLYDYCLRGEEPTKQGLAMKKVLEELNIPYE